jgi:hypothetical protein
MRRGHFTLEIYPSGIRLERSQTYTIRPETEVTRGAIEGFSHEASRRLRESFITLYVEGYNLWAVTLTTHEIFTPKEWRAIMKRFRVAMKYRGWAGLWRVELQKRKAPHAHVAMWLPAGVSLDDVRTLWLASTGEAKDLHAQEHAVYGRQIPHDEAGWAVYIGLHDGKQKEAQLGWLGKQWGVWNRDQFTKREPLKYSGGHRERMILLRTLSKLQRSQLEAKLREKDRAEWALVASYNIPDLYQIPSPRPHLRKMHQGNLLRCIEGQIVVRIMDAIAEDRIG